MSLLEAYMLQRRREQLRLWLGYSAISLTCIGMVVLMLYI